MTGFQNQNLNIGTTLLSWISYSPGRAGILDTPAANWEKIYAGLANASDYDSAYTKLKDTKPSRDAFSSSFPMNLEDLKEAAPQILSYSLPKSLRESESAPFTAEAVHWSEDYDLVVNWKIDDEVLSLTKNFTFQANKNTQGPRKVTVLAGANDGT